MAAKASARVVVGVLAPPTLVVFGAVAPFLPGAYIDGVLTLSRLAQLLGGACALAAPALIGWRLARRGRDAAFGWGAAALSSTASVFVIVSLVLAQPLTDFSRRVAIANSAALIRDIEAHRERHGDYPASLFAVWPDYSPGIAGVASYRYEPQGAAYLLAFEQPRFLFDDFGVREFVAYHPLDEHAITSHAMWRLSHPELQGWFAAHETGTAHWKRFLFD